MLKFWIIASTRLLQCPLWCALSTDFPALHPDPSCFVDLFEMREWSKAFPHDPAGPDHADYGWLPRDSPG
jgi:hypothetical protein